MTPGKALLITALAIGTILLILFDRLDAWHWQHIPLHSTIEALGGITACLISVLLFLRSRKTLEAGMAMLATGFACMGVLDTAHAMSQIGDSFIFLHSVAGFSGGFFFASVWFCRGRHLGNRTELNFIYFGFIALSVSVGMRALLFPQDVPKIMPLFDGNFTMAAIMINLTAGLLFLASVFQFSLMYRQKRHSQDLLFACLAYLFGISALIFPFSKPWNGMWWVWHFIRLPAFFITLAFISNRYRKYLGGHEKTDQGETDQGETKP